MLQRERVRRTGHELFAMQFGKAPMQTCTTIQKSGMVKFAGSHFKSVRSPESGIFVARNAIADMRHQILGILTQTATRERRFHNLNDSQQRR